MPLPPPDVLPATTIEEALDSQIHGWLDTERWRLRDEEIERARALL